MIAKWIMYMNKTVDVKKHKSGDGQKKWYLFLVRWKIVKQIVPKLKVSYGSEQWKLFSKVSGFRGAVYDLNGFSGLNFSSYMIWKTYLSCRRTDLHECEWVGVEV